MTIQLNERAWRRCDNLAASADRLNVKIAQTPEGTRVVDCGIEAAGGIEAGLLMADVCLADLARVQVQQGSVGDWSGPLVAVHTDQPLLACMASQYAGWQIAVGKFFAMGSGPMRAVAAKEPLFAEMKLKELSDRVVGVLETSKLPDAEIGKHIAAACQVSPDHVILLAARTASIAGTLQVVARSVETALHKLHALGYDLKNVASGFGSAPLPPVAKDDLAGIGRTNDAILYGGQVTLWVRDDDARLAELGPKVPSSASPDYGEPFATIFERAGRDFYKIDGMLFSPAVVMLMNLASGKSHRFGELRPDILAKSFAT